MDNINCEWMFYEPNECKKCLLLGYHYSCGSQECKEARENSYGKSIKTNALYGGGDLNYKFNTLIDYITDMLPVTPTFPKGATNGDMIKAMFSSVEVKEKNNGYEVYFGIGTATQYFNHQWWNAPYKRGSEND